MKNVSDRLFEILEDRDYRVAQTPGITNRWIGTKYYTHSEKKASLVDLLIISKLDPSRMALAMNRVADALDQHCSAFMSEIKSEFDALKTNEGNSNSHLLQTLKRLIPRLEPRKISLPMSKALIHRIDGNTVTFQVNPIILVDDESTSSLDLRNSSGEWFVAFGNHERYKMHIVPISKFEKFLEAKAESAKKMVEQLSEGGINRLTKPLSISQKVFTILGCVWGLLALDIVLKTNIIPLNLYWSSLLIGSLAISMVAIALIMIGGIKFRRTREDHFILPTESHQVLQPSIASRIKTECSESDEQFPLNLPKSTTAKSLNDCLGDFKKTLKHAKSDFENRAFSSFFVKAQSALYSALKAKYFELTNRSPGILSFSQLVNVLRKNELTLPSDKEIGKWTKTVELALLDKDNISFKTAKDYLVYLSRFISTLKPFEDRGNSRKSVYSKTQEKDPHEDLISNMPTQT
ncbi:MAG: HEPN domain-containing protein [Promethearchaeota archaeon]